MISRSRPVSIYETTDQYRFQLIMASFLGATAKQYLYLLYDRWLEQAFLIWSAHQDVLWLFDQISLQESFCFFNQLIWPFCYMIAYYLCLISLSWRPLIFLSVFQDRFVYLISWSGPVCLFDQLIRTGLFIWSADQDQFVYLISWSGPVCLFDQLIRTSLFNWSADQDQFVYLISWSGPVCLFDQLIRTS